MDYLTASKVCLNEELEIGVGTGRTGRVVSIEHVMEGDPYKASGDIYYNFTVKSRDGSITSLPQEFFSRIDQGEQP